MSDQSESDSHKELSELVDVLNQYVRDRCGMTFAIFVFTVLALFYLYVDLRANVFPELLEALKN
ncbi:MAG TPA: hypothetical protein DIT97_04800 [Gimesia maris]|uniref:Uncharacterized protein n=1 Tax=Gimesia maris TaxID=122 RepID=A0A3D3R489_9PLAN|nr:hypothetical protein [Gimesia maris]|tara:strand:+ start:37686 stop:37877 length:192 start_codon:yes stop_codon:yes gene_type:complete